MADDLYGVLGLAPDATSDQIKAAYRKLAKKHHPDLNPGNKNAEKLFKEINTANEILGDPEKRAKFDRGEIDATGNATHAHAGQESGAGRGPFYYETQQDGGRYASAFEGFGSDFIEELLRGQGRSPRHQADEHYSLKVDFRDSILGAEQDMRLPTGKTIKVRIPPGVESGKKLRLKGLAGPTSDQHPVGDVYIEIQVQPSKIFSRVGKNLEVNLPITFSEAILGSEVRIPTLEKPIMLKIPQGASTGTKLRVKGRGVAAAKEADRGDLIATLKIVMPAKIDSELEEAVRNWSKTHSYNPREQLEKEGGST